MGGEEFSERYKKEKAITAFPFYFFYLRIFSSLIMDL